MNSARWERVQQIVAEALEHPAQARQAFVDSQSADDPDVRSEILSLLDAASIDDLPTGWLESLAEPEGDRFAPGDLLAGRYRIRHLLGRGGMGEVYEADDEELEITVALKTLRELGSHESAFERLKLEGMLARAVWHPNVCRVYEVGRHDELCFLAMERLHGRTLQERLREEGPFTLERALRIAAEVSAGLGAAHRAGVVHRDLKPANVMLVRRDGEEHAVVMDFGTGSSGRSRGMAAGTPAYMAPEQFRGEEVGPAADVYALGLVLCEIVTGILPALEAMPALTPPWDAVIRRCLHPEPRRRFARAEDVFEALAGRDTDRTMAPSSNWPSELDAFVGREADLAAVERALDSSLVTLVGPGGMGKTRLAIRSGRRASFAGGAFFCDLTEAQSADGIAAAVGRALSVQLGRGDAIVQLGHAIAGRGACLLVLDNFEQVVAHAAETVGRWRTLAPEATFLVTSRERLGLEGERVLAVEPLSADEALGLFTLRARGLRPGFALSSNEGAAREIVALLDGIPLAIELAAARIRVMSVEQILLAMRKRFQLLAGGSGARHETLEGTIDESWELLAPWERAAFSQCAVFEGGCTLEAAAGVLELAEWPQAPAVVDVVASLVDKSLLRSWAPLRAGESAPEVRFGMYVSLQEYARKRLHASIDAERSAEVRHGNFYAAYDDSRIERELDNLVSACRRAIQRGDGAVVAATYRGAWQVLRSKGPLGTALALGSEALADPRLEDEARAMVEVGLGEAHWYAGRFEEARAHAVTALATARRCDAPLLQARAAATLGRSEFTLGKVEPAGIAFGAALEIARRIGDAPSLCIVLNGLGMMHHELGRTEEARLEYEEALAITRDIGDRVQEAITLLSLGILHHKRGHLEEAGALFEQSLAIHGETGNRRSAGIVHSNLVGLRSDQGRMPEAREHAEAALAIARAIGSRVNEGTALAVLGELHTQTGELDEARGFFESGLALQRELGNRRMEGIIMDGIAHLDWLRNDYDAARAGFEAALAIHRDIGDRHYEGGSLTSLATVLLDAGSHAEARAALDLAQPILREIAAHHELARTFCVRAELEQSLGDAVAAHAALAEAEAVIAGSNSQPGNELERALARARRALAGVSA